MNEILDLDIMIVPEKLILPEESKHLKYQHWQVFLDDELIDNVIYLSNLTAIQVKCKLIVEDGYPMNIKIVKE